MEAYLLDTNAASVLWDELHPWHAEARKFMRARKQNNDRVYISRIVIAENRYGYELFESADPTRKQILLDAMSAFPLVKEIGPHTVEPYAKLRAALYKEFAPRNARGHVKKKQPEELIDRTTAKSLGIQENDLWTAAIAVEYNLVLVTDDRMSRIRQVAATDLRCCPWRSAP